MNDPDNLKQLDDLFKNSPDVTVIKLGSLADVKAMFAKTMDVPAGPLTWHDEPATPALGRRAEPYDPGCGRYASQIPGIVQASEEDGASPAEYARGDGTYNTTTNHFLCDACYIQAGQPTAPGPRGWVCP